MKRKHFSIRRIKLYEKFSPLTGKHSLRLRIYLVSFNFNVYILYSNLKCIYEKAQRIKLQG